MDGVLTTLAKEDAMMITDFDDFSLWVVILDFELAPVNESDLSVGAELLAEHTDLTVVGDKG